MFDHPNIQTFQFNEIPLDQDLSLMDEKWLAEYETALVASVSGTGDSAYKVGYYAYASARAIGSGFIELSWYPNISNRFHEVRITLPDSAFVTCVGSWEYDYKPVIFVRGSWLTNLHLRSHSVFALVDAINVKQALLSGALTREKLIELRNRVDVIAGANPSVALMSFADSLLLKSNYSVGQFDSAVKYTYEPERILRLLPDIKIAYSEVLGLNIYVVITQGTNEYYDDDLIHTSANGHHISFNSLGLPFAQIQAIEHSARVAFKAGHHDPADVYLDETFYHSLNFRPGIDKSGMPKFPYEAPMATGSSFYFPVSFKFLTDNLDT